MEALELIQLGRSLVKLGEQGLRGANGGPGARGELPVGAAMVMRDVLTHDGATVGEITTRTGLPQSYVSESVARLRDEGLLVTETDPDDRRRTRVSTGRAHLKEVVRKGHTSVDALLLEALDDVGPREARRLLSSLDAVAAQLRPTEAGPVVRLLDGAS